MGQERGHKKGRGGKGGGAGREGQGQKRRKKGGAQTAEGKIRMNAVKDQQNESAGGDRGQRQKRRKKGGQGGGKGKGKGGKRKGGKGKRGEENRRLNRRLQSNSDSDSTAHGGLGIVSTTEAVAVMEAVVLTLDSCVSSAFSSFDDEMREKNARSCAARAVEMARGLRS